MIQSNSPNAAIKTHSAVFLKNFILLQDTAAYCLGKSVGGVISVIKYNVFSHNKIVLFKNIFKDIFGICALTGKIYGLTLEICNCLNAFSCFKNVKYSESACCKNVYTTVCL
jgi:hypothetical protein